MPLLTNFILSMALAVAGRCYPYLTDCWPQIITPPPVVVQDNWAHIVTGESSGQWPDGSQLVGWTLRAWQVYKGMPADMAGKRWGWNGWRPPTVEAYNVVHEVWGQPPTNSPFDFMQAGHYCARLGSDQDLRYWRWIGWDIGTPNFVLESPNGLHMNCFYQ